MKRNITTLVIALTPVFLFAQTERKGWYANLGLGYSAYKVYVYNYNGGSDAYDDQQFSQPEIRVGGEKKSFFNKGGFVIDAGAEIVGGIGTKVKRTRADDTKGWSIGINGLLKAGYKLNSGNIVPVIGVGPYFISLQNTGKDSFSSQVYGAQGFVGIDLKVNGIIITPNIHFGIASWSTSDVAIGRADNVQNGQPSMFQAGLKLGIRL